MFELIIGLLIGLVIGFFLARKKVKDDLKKNPPVNEKMLRVMFMEMGRKPSEAQIKQMVKSINDQIK